MGIPNSVTLAGMVSEIRLLPPVSYFHSQVMQVMQVMQGAQVARRTRLHHLALEASG
jgi:hypothetical protein